MIRFVEDHQNHNGAELAELLRKAAAVGPDGGAVKIEDYAPRCDAERARLDARSAGDRIRRACAAAGDAVLAALDDAEARLRHARDQAERFIADVNSIGSYHADRIVEVLQDLHGVIGRMQAERVRMDEREAARRTERADAA